MREQFSNKKRKIESAASGFELFVFHYLAPAWGKTKPVRTDSSKTVPLV